MAGLGACANVKVVLDVPTSYKIKQPLISVPVIESKNSRGVDFYLEPKECGVSSIGGDVIYKTASGEKKNHTYTKKRSSDKMPLSCIMFIDYRRYSDYYSRSSK